MSFVADECYDNISEIKVADVATKLDPGLKKPDLRDAGCQTAELPSALCSKCKAPIKKPASEVEGVAGPMYSDFDGDDFEDDDSGQDTSPGRFLQQDLVDDEEEEDEEDRPLVIDAVENGLDDEEEESGQITAWESLDTPQELAHRVNAQDKAKRKNSALAVKRNVMGKEWAPNSFSSTFTCLFCQEEFRKDSKLKLHLMQMHKHESPEDMAKAKEVLIKSKLDGCVHKCALCGSKYNSVGKSSNSQVVRTA
jgi:hypothetical protein